MVLSRFWLVIFISSIVFVIFSLFSGDSYTIDHVLNGKKDDPILISEKFAEELPVFIKDRTPKEYQYPIFVALERGLNVSGIANIQPTAIESQI